MDSLDLRTALPDRPRPPEERGTPKYIRWIAISVLALFLLGEIVLIAEQLLGW